MQCVFYPNSVVRQRLTIARYDALLLSDGNLHLTRSTGLQTRGVRLSYKAVRRSLPSWDVGRCRKCVQIEERKPG